MDLILKWSFSIAFSNWKLNKIAWWQDCNAMQSWRYSSCRSMQINQKSGDKKASKSKPVLNYSPTIINQVNDLLDLKCKITLNPFTSICILLFVTKGFISMACMCAVCWIFGSVRSSKSGNLRLSVPVRPSQSVICNLHLSDSFTGLYAMLSLSLEPGGA